MAGLPFVDRNCDLKDIEENVKNKFRWFWLDEKDVNGDTVSEYFRKLSEPGTGYCSYCDQRINYAGRGKSLITRHAESQHHIKRRNHIKSNQSNFVCVLPVLPAIIPLAATYPENRRADIDSTVRNIVELPLPGNNLGILPKKQDSECETEIKTEIDGDVDSCADQVPVDSAPYPSSSYDNANSQTSTSPLKNENLPFSNVAKKRKLEDDDETVQLSKENKPNLLQEDEHDTFGKTVAFKLRTLPMEQRLRAEKLVSEVLYEASFGSLSRNTRLTGLINTNNECTSCSSSSSQRNCDNVRSTVDAQT